MLITRSAATYALAFLFCSASLNAFDARYAPAEENVNWPAPQSDFDKAVTAFGHPLISNANILTGVVSVDGARDRALIARLDDNGNVIWSRRLPASSEDAIDGLNLASATHLMANYTSGGNGQRYDYFGSFNPENGFAARYTKRLPALEADPLNPFAGNRTYQPQRDGKLALVEISGNEAYVMMLGETGSVLFSRNYTLPAGGGSTPFPIPGLGFSYAFITLFELDNGDFYLSTNGVDPLAQSTKAVVLRLNSSGDIIWQRTIDVPGSSAFVSPRLNGKVLISGGLMGTASLASRLILLSEDGALEWAQAIDGAMVNGFSFNHLERSGEIMLQGFLATDLSNSSFLSDGVVLILSEDGTKLAEAAYDIGETDFLLHVGTFGDSLYFELFGQDSATSGITHGILARSDGNLDNWIARSYFDLAGPSANSSAFFAQDGKPLLSYRDPNQDWISISQLDQNLQESGTCPVLEDIPISIYDPNLSVSSFNPTIAEAGVTSRNWDAPDLEDASFSLEPTPLTVERVCGSGNTVQSLWTGVTPVNAAGDKRAGIGWINDTEYPYIWHYSIGGWVFILNEFSDLNSIYGYDYVNQFFFLSNDAWGGWYINLLDNDWGIGGWDKWD